ncbi:MAG: DUF3450 domain-containing protein [Rhodospirillaceae bacterium]|nr:DUF3450 domain-containing protein [Rhodospirillaceae bacterium]
MVVAATSNSPVGRVSLRLCVSMLVTLGGYGAMPAAAQSNESQLNQAVAAQSEVDKAGAASQQRIDQVRDKIDESARTFAQAIADAESLERYNKQLSEQVKSQEEELASIERQLREIETTTREVQPLMERMVETLDRYVALDLPYFQEERRRRVDNLKANLDRADLSVSEKYRAILEAYQIELEYGRTLGTYEGKITIGGADRFVQFVQLGSVALMYQTLDGQETGYWDAQKAGWVVDNSYAENVREALRVAKGNGAAALLTVPVSAPQEVK